MHSRVRFATAIVVLSVVARVNAEDPPSNRKRIATPSTEERRLEHAGIRRVYRLHLPPTAPKGKPLPLVIVLHGAAANGAITEGLTQFSFVADKHGFAVAYPSADTEGKPGAWEFWAPAEKGPRHKAANNRGRDDFGFIAALIDDLVGTGVADPKRVYVTGISNGAYFSHQLASRYSDRIAAVAPVAGTMITALAATAKPTRPVPILYLHGTDDKFIGIDGVDFLSHRKSSLSAQEMVAWWVKQNGCTGPPECEVLPRGKDGMTVERTMYRGKAPVVFYSISGGGHTWPGGSPFQPEALLGKVCRSLDASEVMWEFFSKQSLPTEGKKEAAAKR
jgi:polyhydroxybutyrate depolymerase